MVPIDSQRPTFATIDLDALAFNFRSVREFIGTDLKYLAVVKADAYGHGAVECSRWLSSIGVDWLGVATLEEGIELRDAGIDKPILLLGGFWPGQEGYIIDRRLTPVIFTGDQAEFLDRAALKAGQLAKYHLKVDTGMGRIGMRHDGIENLAEKLTSFENIRLDGVMTHFAAADNLSENAFTDGQMRLFDLAVEKLRERGFDPTYLDMANSPGAIAHPQSRRMMVRLGGVLYGLGDDVLPAEIEKPELRPVMSVTSRIASIKSVPAGETLGYGRTFETTGDSTIATVAIGYADGYPRVLSNVSRVIVNGQFAPVVGRISMDWTIIDVTDIPDCRVGDEVVLIGQQGKCRITAEDLAKLADTISYEITCGIGKRVPRIFLPL